MLYLSSGCGVIRYREIKELPDSQTTKAFRVFPNPVKQGSVINFRTDSNTNETLMVRIFTVNGQLSTTLRVPGNNGYASMLTDPRLSTGTYFLQAVYENGRLAASGKLVVQ